MARTRRALPLVLSTVLVGAAAAPANAASTRAEYIAQLDPICQSFVDSHDAALGAYNRSAKRLLHLSRSRTPKAWLAATRRASKLLTALTQNELALLDQIAAVPPPVADTGTIGTWLNGRRQSDAFAALAAAALNRPVPQVHKFFKRIKQANSAFDAAERAIDGFGFQVCGVSV